MKTTHKPRAGILAGIVALASFALQGESLALTVTNNKDNAPSAALIAGSLRWAIAGTPANGLVDFASGMRGKTILLKSGQLVVDKPMTIRGLGSDKLTVSGNSASRVFFTSGIPGFPGQQGVSITDLTITKGNAVGVDLSGFGNDSNGGGIHNVGLLHLTRVVVTGNTAALGGGGGIFNRGTLSPVAECSISYNTAGQCGGGVFNKQDMTIVRSDIANNVAGTDGGGLQECGTSVLLNCTFAANRAAGSGGGINDAGGTIDIRNSTISANCSSLGGGLAVPIFGSSTTLRNTIIAGNSPKGPSNPAPDVSDLFIDGSSGILISVGFNLIGTTVGTGPGSFISSDLLNVNPKLGPLQNNGGPTLTMALLPGSPAIDAGSNANLLSSMTTDQRAFMVRIINGGFSNTVDIGAYEYTTARALKNEAISDLTPCLTSTDCRTRIRAAAAILRIQRSLTPALWVNDTTLTRCGELVFEKEEEAAYLIQKIIKDSPDAACVEAAIYAAEDLVLADEQLAREAIRLAVAANGNAGKIQDANKELVTAQSYLAKQDYKGAIEHFEHAWERAQEAVGIKPDDETCKALKKLWENDSDDDDDDDDDCN